ncbi:hypothetical protein T484DRAFT_1792600, partial [Baffinella frigidus]
MAAYEAHCAREGRRVPLLLDSCCGTGRSTQNIAAAHPEHFVIGVDKSLSRLNRTSSFRASATNGNADAENAPPAPNTISSSLGGSGAEAAVLVCGNCVDFWRLLWESGVRIERHTLYYPNP